MQIRGQSQSMIGNKTSYQFARMSKAKQTMSPPPQFEHSPSQTRYEDNQTSASNLKTDKSYASLTKRKLEGRNARMLVSMDYGKSHKVSPLKRTMQNSHNSSGTVLGI